MSIKDIALRLMMGLVVLVLACAILILAGCACVRISTPEYTATGVSLFKSIDIPKIVKGGDGSVIVEGYKGDVEAAALGEIIGTAVKTAGVK